MNIFKLCRLDQVVDSNKYDVKRIIKTGTSRLSTDTQLPRPVATRIDVRPTGIEKSKNIQESLCLLHGLANLIIENHFQISTAGNKSLTTIAQEFECGPPTATEALSLLLNDNKTTVCTRFDSGNGNAHLTDIFHALISATGQSIDISAIKSEMNAGDEQCVVTFKTGSRIQRWKFKQTGDRVAKNFLTHLINCIGISANGQFVMYKHHDKYITFTFIPKQLYEVFANVLKLNLTKITHD